MLINHSLERFHEGTDPLDTGTICVNWHFAKNAIFCIFSLKSMVYDGLGNRKPRIRKALDTPIQVPSYIEVSLVQAELQTKIRIKCTINALASASGTQQPKLFSLNL